MKAVVDASILIRTIVPDHYTDETRHWLSGVKELLAPHLLWYEVTSALRRLEYMRLIDCTAADQALAVLLNLQIRICGRRPIYQQMLRLARELNTSRAYDMAYLALALEENCALFTLDEKLINNARTQGYNVKHPIEALSSA